MSSTTSLSSLAASLAILLILLVVTAGTEGDVTELLTLSNTTSNSSSTTSRSFTSSSISISTSSSKVSTSSTTSRVVGEVVAGQGMSVELNRTNEMELSSSSRSSNDPRRYVTPTRRLTNERAGVTSLEDFEGSSSTTAEISIASTTMTSNDKLESVSSAVNIQEDVEAYNKPQQQQLIGLIDNVTNNFEMITEPKVIFQEVTSSEKIDTVTRPIEFSKPTEVMDTTTRRTTTSTTTISTSTRLRMRPNTTMGADGGRSSVIKSRNDLLGGNFHEIKPAQKVNTKLLGYFGKVVKPNIPSSLGKYTPYFEDGQDELNVTSRIGSTVILDCEIGMLNNKTVTWSHRSADVIRLLTFGRNAYSVDQRISLSFKYPTNWRLRIQYATPRDSGLYECQVATYPPLVKKIHLLVTAPMLVIMDDSGRIKSGERHLKAGSALRLRCEARDVPEQYNETVIWTRGDEILSEDVSENRTTDVFEGREVQVIISTFVIEKATPRHAGNYSCVVPEKAKATVAVHVLNGELPAAVHDGNGVSRSVFNLWLIHLTVSCVFSR